MGLEKPARPGTRCVVEGCTETGVRLCMWFLMGKKCWLPFCEPHRPKWDDLMKDEPPEFLKLTAARGEGSEAVGEAGRTLPPTTPPAGPQPEPSPAEAAGGLCSFCGDPLSGETITRVNVPGVGWVAGCEKPDCRHLAQLASDQANQMRAAAEAEGACGLCGHGHKLGEACEEPQRAGGMSVPCGCKGI